MFEQTVFKLLALSFMGGIVCGALWDVFKAPRVLFGLRKHKAKRIVNLTVSFAWDVVFCLVCGCVATVAFYYGNEGVFRGVAIAVMAVGFWSYRVSIGAFVGFIANKICLTVKKAGCWLASKIKEKLKRKVKEE